MAIAVVYTSNTGYTAEYARLLGGKIGLPAYTLGEAADKLAENSEIIYLGWLMAGVVKGYKKAAKRYRIDAVCGIGMGGTGTQLGEVKKANALPDSLPLFTLQGGFDMNRLHGVYKLMMKLMKASHGGKLEKKENRSADENAMLDMLLHGASYVSPDNLAAVLDWYRTARQ